jgi:GDP-fucose protein O-fucosyltransferase
MQLLVDRMKSFGPYIALHLRYEKDMLAFSGCTYGLSETESDELTAIRYPLNKREHLFANYIPVIVPSLQKRILSYPYLPLTIF